MNDDVDPKHLPDAPVPWERSDAVPMRPAEDGEPAPAAPEDRRPITTDDWRPIAEGEPEQPAEGGRR
jgi:hypothetical protein